MSIMEYSSWDDAGSRFGAPKSGGRAGNTLPPPSGSPTAPPISYNPTLAPPSNPNPAPAPSTTQPWYGSSGFNFGESISRGMTGGTPDPRLSNYGITWNNGNGTEGGQGSWQVDPNNPYGLDGQGTFTRNGVGYLQVPETGGMDRVKDPSLVTYDPVMGYITPLSNYKQPEDDFLDRYALAIVAGLAGGIALGPGLAAGEAGAAGAAGVDAGLDFGGAALDAGGTAAGITDGLDFSLLPPIDATYVPGIADGAMPVIDQAIDTALLPPITETTIPDLVAPPTFDAGGSGASAFPSIDDPMNIGNPTLTDPTIPTIPPPEIPGAAGPSIWDRISNNPIGSAAAAASLVNTLGANRASRDPNAGVPPALQNNTTSQDNKPILDQARSTILNNGAPTDAQKHSIDAQIDQHKKEAREAILQKAINSGMGANSQVTQQQLDKMDLQAENLRGQMYMQQAEQNIGNAIKEWGEANAQDLGIQQLIANYQLKNSAAAQERSASISQTLAMIYAMSNSRGGF